MENTMNVKGKYKYYVKYDGLRHNLWMVIKYKVMIMEVIVHWLYVVDYID